MSVQRLQQQSNFYTPLSKTITKTSVSVINAYETLLSITGKGYLSKMVYYSTTTSYTYTIRLTIDGVVYWLDNQSTNSFMSGFSTEDLMVEINTSGSIGVRCDSNIAKQVSSAMVDLPYTTNAGAHHFTWMGSPIQFKQSVLLEVQANNVAAGLQLSILGGIQ